MSLQTTILYLGVSNFAIGIGNFVVILAAWSLAVFFPRFRSLGRHGAIFATFLSLFFFAAGSHRLDIATFFFTSTDPTEGQWAALNSLLVWDAIQAASFVAMVVMLVWKGKHFVRRLSVSAR